MALTHEAGYRAGTRRISSIASDEHGQVLPLLLVVMVALLAAGVLVFWLGFSTSVATDAQTAADAAALGAEQKVDTEWNSTITVDGVVLLRDSYTPSDVETAARDWAGRNHATVTSIKYCDQSGSSCSPQPVFTSEPDVLVSVKTNQTLGSDSPSPGGAATAQARASLDPYAQASPPVAQPSMSCDPSSAPSLPPVKAQAEQGSRKDTPGFFENADTKFGPQDPCEYSLAAHLDALGKSLGVHLVGTWGAGADNPAGKSVKTPDAVAQAHACGALAEVQNLPKDVTEKQLGRWGLASFPGQPDQIEFAATKARCTTSTTPPTQNANDQSATVGNGDIHLVPLTGGPQGSALLGIGAIPGVGPWPAIASYLPFYRKIAKQYGWDQGQVQDWLAVEQIEDAAGDLGIAPDKAFGLAQFQTVNYCRYGPGSCPASNPTAEQELESMAQYIHDRYGNPAAALQHELANNPHWY